MASTTPERIDLGDGYVPVGVRFFPSDHEVIQPYLLSKIFGTKLAPLYPINEIDLSMFDPNEIVFDEGNETYFYSCLVHNKCGKGMLRRMGAKGGYWEASGGDLPIYSDQQMKVLVGFKKNWESYWGEGNKSVWTMTEYRANPRLIPADQMNDDIKTRIVSYAVCKIKKQPA